MGLIFAFFWGGVVCGCCCWLADLCCLARRRVVPERVLDGESFLSSSLPFLSPIPISHLVSSYPIPSPSSTPPLSPIPNREQTLMRRGRQSVGGYFIRAVNLPRFWYYRAHFIDYQTYAFDLLVFDDFHGITLGCTTMLPQGEGQGDGSCFCDYPSSLIAQGQCALAGDDVLQVRTAFFFVCWRKEGS